MNVTDSSGPLAAIGSELIANVNPLFALLSQAVNGDEAHMFDFRLDSDDAGLQLTAMSDNVLRVDRVLKRLGQEKAKEERPNLPRNLPSAAFIKNYLR
ncbi:unnamed protein product [Dibothriocephalus latus]|uniref:Uncharacterized protein n=1 Tax=Dibothriocephalus latus TaxID=60516 RepID=A0A3P7LYF8_DIBLA|nr:unnamed protein product [Dibothriocephalus latus]